MWRRSAGRRQRVSGERRKARRVQPAGPRTLMVMPFSRSRSIESIFAPTPSLPRTWRERRRVAARSLRVGAGVARLHSAWGAQNALSRAASRRTRPPLRRGRCVAGRRRAARRRLAKAGRRPGARRTPHLVDLVDAAGVEQDALRQRGLAAVDVRGDANVAQLVQRLANTTEARGGVVSATRGDANGVQRCAVARAPCLPLPPPAPREPPARYSGATTAARKARRLRRERPRAAGAPAAPRAAPPREAPFAETP